MVKAFKCSVDLTAHGARMTWEACVQWHVCPRAITEASGRDSLPRALSRSGGILARFAYVGHTTNYDNF